MNRCEYRRECLVDLIVDGIELQVPRSVLGRPCYYEVTQDLVSCVGRNAFRTRTALHKLSEQWNENLDALILDTFLNG